MTKTASNKNLSYLQANVLVNAQGHGCLCDFGLSRMSEDTLWDTSATQAAGSLRWSAPELLRAEQKHVTKESDIYAYAMTCFVCLAAILSGLLSFINRRSFLAKCHSHLCIMTTKYLWLLPSKAYGHLALSPLQPRSKFGASLKNAGRSRLRIDLQPQPYSGKSKVWQSKLYSRILVSILT